MNRTVKYQGAFSGILGFAGKHFLFSSPTSIFFCSRSNFRAITRLETLARQATFHADVLRVTCSCPTLGRNAWGNPENIYEGGKAQLQPNFLLSFARNIWLDTKVEFSKDQLALLGLGGRGQKRFPPHPPSPHCYLATFLQAYYLNLYEYCR